MKKLTVFAFALFIMVAAGSTAMAENIYLNDWFFNINDVIYSPIDTPLDASFNTGGFDFSQPDSNLGSITITFTAAGSYKVIGFFDLDIEGTDPANPLDNELGIVNDLGSLEPGQHYEIGPGESVVPGVFDDAYTTGVLTDTNSATTPMDVAMALGWNFDIVADHPMALTFTLGFQNPGGFSLQQKDGIAATAPGTSIYYSSSLTEKGEPVIPEPSTLLLLGTGLGLTIAAFRKRR
jgi:hypothetical protein